MPGQGSPNADIMFIGEGPGFNEDKQGVPFVGAAGQFLNTLLASIGLSRETVYITNMVKCRPPNNRDPLPEETAACAHYLDAQVAAIAPKIIVPLGRHALGRWFPNESIGRLRARPRVFDGITLFPLYHPAAALHNGDLRSTIADDFLKLGALLEDLVDVQQKPPSTPAVAPAPEPAPAAVVEAAENPTAPTAPAQPSPAVPPEPDEPPAQQLNLF